MPEKVPAMKALTREQLETARDALVSGYNNWHELDQFAAFALDIHLERDIGYKGAPLNTVAFELLKFANARGLTEALLREAIARNQGNGRLKEIGKTLGLAAAPFSTGSPTAGYEAIISRESGLESTGSWRLRMASNEARVCQILFKGEAIGTGFLVGPALVMSNWHVFESPPGSGALGSVADYAARFDFRAAAGAAPADSGSIVGFDAAQSYLDASHKNELDYVLLALAEPVGNAALPDGTARGWLSLGTREFEPNETCVVLQHPMRRTLEVAMGAVTGWVKASEHQVYEHLANTEEGSSGSPCFAPNWTLLGLHHRVDPNSGLCNRAIATPAILGRMGAKGTIGLLPSLSA